MDIKNNKTSKRVNGGLSLYYGFGMLITGIIGVIVSVVLGVKIILGNEEHTPGSALGVLVIAIVVGALGYALTRSGYEELED